jgi:hypothetical protein
MSFEEVPPSKVILGNANMKERAKKLPTGIPNSEAFL